ncbi:MAG: carbohydrate ABC transporter permease [Lachnospiraceae bacterium]|nr:carbohydrate ABC transporter permease [Lachnospiraceae bacterium]
MANVNPAARNDLTAAELKKAERAAKKEAKRVAKIQNKKKPKKGKEKRLNRSMAGNTILFTLMIICGLFMVLPLVMIINNCLKPLDELYQFPPKIFVRNPTLENFSDLFVLMNDSWVPFSRYILNTIIITLGGMLGHVICASLAAYPLAKHKFPGRDLLFSMVVLSMMFSWQVTQIPQYLIISWLGINNTYAALILPAWSFGMGLYLMKQFMEQLPDSLMESARLDGATEWTIFWKIVMPNVKPAWLTLAIFQFQQMWANTGSIFLRDEQLKPMQFALQQITAGGTRRAGAAAAVTFIIAAVPITFFLICQRNVLETMTTSGMKD